MEATHWGINGVVVDSVTKQPIHQVRGVKRQIFGKVFFLNLDSLVSFDATKMGCLLGIWSNHDLILHLASKNQNTD